jgi:hypothetical protein
MILGLITCQHEWTGAMSARADGNTGTNTSDGSDGDGHTRVPEVMETEVLEGMEQGRGSRHMKCT